MKTVIFYTTQTSGTGSIWRIYSALVKGKKNCVKFVSSYRDSNTISEIKDAIIPDNGDLVQFNLPTEFNKNSDLEKYHYLINFRDPRDRICNVYHWKMVHPYLNTSEKKIKKIKEKIIEDGIDKFVIERINNQIKYYENIFYVLENVRDDNICVLTYARLCLNFDSFLNSAANFLKIDLTPKLLESLEDERIEKIESNRLWIGQRFKGADILPGRYKHELKPETIAILNEKFEPILRKMAKYDPDYASLYLEGLDN